MSKSVIFDVDKEAVGKLVDHIQEKYPDSLIVMAPFSGNISTYAPSKSGKYKDHYRIKAEIWIPKDAIKGESAISDFGAFAVMRLPKDRVQDHLKG